MRLKKKIVAGMAAGAVVIGAGGAFAFWTQGGTGNGAATAGTSVAITVVQTATITGLYPGGTASALSGTFNNPNAFPVNITSVTAAVQAFSTTAVDATKPPCTQADFTIAGTSGPYTVPAGTTGTWSGLNVALRNTALNQDNCKGQTITINYTANP